MFELVMYSLLVMHYLHKMRNNTLEIADWMLKMSTVQGFVNLLRPGCSSRAACLTLYTYTQLCLFKGGMQQLQYAIGFETQTAFHIHARDTGNAWILTHQPQRLSPQHTRLSPCLWPDTPVN